MEKYAKVRIACNIDELSIRQAAKEFEIHRKTVKKMLQNSEPPGYCRIKAVKFPVLNDHIDFIDSILISDKVAPKKQRHTIRRIYNRLVTERNFTGGYTTVRDYVRKNYKHHKEMFVPLIHEPGTAQADFGEAVAIIGGQELKIHYLAMILPQSDHSFVKAYLRENTESFCDAHVSAFEFFGGVPNVILYDNTSIAVASILGDGTRKRTSAFTALQSHYLFKDKFANICKGNEKGSVENFVGYARRNFMVPIPNIKNIEELNAHLLKSCKERMKTIIGNHKETIAERFIRDQVSLITLPTHRFEACRIKNGRVNSESLVRFEQNDYSVPIKYGYKDVIIRGYVDIITIGCGNETIAIHSRSYEKGEKIYDPLHYLPLIERKIASFTQAAPLKKLVLPGCFDLLLGKLENKYGLKDGRREYIRILQLLLEFDLTILTHSVEQAIVNGVLDASCIKHIILHHKEKRPSPLEVVSHLPKIEISLPNLHEYNTLLNGGTNV